MVIDWILDSIFVVFIVIVVVVVRFVGNGKDIVFVIFCWIVIMDWVIVKFFWIVNIVL